MSETTSGAGNNGLQDKGTLFIHEHVNVIIHSEWFPMCMELVFDIAEVIH